MWYWPLTVLDFLMGYSNLLSVFAGILAWEYFTKTATPAEVRWSLYGGAFLAITFRNWHRGNMRAKDAESALAAERENARRVFAEDPELVLALLTEPWSMRAVPLVDKWITISGRVEGSADSLLKDAIYLSLILERGQRVNLRFSNAGRDRLQTLRKGQLVTAVCQIRPSHGAIALENCEFRYAGAAGLPLALAS